MGQGDGSKKRAVVFAVIGLGLLGVVLYRVFAGGGPDDPDRLVQDVTIRCEETGEEWEMLRGRLEQQLRRTPGQIDPEVGLINPSTGRPTGFPTDRDAWRAMVERINAAKRDAGS